MSDTPGPNPSVSDDEILRTIRMAYSPALGTVDIADEIGLSQQATLKHLKRLSESGYLESKKIGHVKIWWLTDAGKQKIAQSDQ